jgi:8-oxo-dGTP pyrophosphatase MutT (NUDIX family)
MGRMSDAVTQLPPTVMDTRVGCYAIVVDDRRRILLAHWNEDGRTGWTLPGGGLDRGEQPDECVVREVLEETGYAVRLDDLLGVQVGELPAERRIVRGRGDLRLVRVIFRAHIVSGDLRHEADGTTDEARWVPLDEVADLDRVDLVDIGLAMWRRRATPWSRKARQPTSSEARGRSSARR